MDWTWNHLADKKFQFMDHSLVAVVRSLKDKEALEFFKLLSLCHTVMVEHKDGSHTSTQPFTSALRATVIFSFDIR